ncbi:zinc-binding metallopeptidase [Mucilaginibacter paludis]|uniref:Lipoprotein n=1 Tax=Mucilaginibacter paludis DSM 18603 TaxID=714943 RepID=H1Y337_9SPHI|nr:hypothetical protein [Mucilaginibacter paludis]EHQ28855.1 hypothetical protein Mucpa_4770 [Mucilaginibacter paludis DSM 18603]
MKIFKLTLVMLFAVAIMVSCKKSDGTLSPSGLSEAYVIPQGTHTYDATIVGYLQSYNTNILYNFTDRDAYWTPTAWTKPTGPSSIGYWTPGVELSVADQNYVGAQLDLIKKKWFNFYSDKFLKKFLPSKILLCSKLDSVINTLFFTPTVGYTKSVKSVAAYYSYDNITVNYGSAAVTTMTKNDSMGFVAKANLIFIQSMIARGVVTPTTEFINSADYATTMTSTTQSYGKGIIVGYSSPSATADWNAYITAMVSYSEPNLNASVAITNTTAAGILNATKDVNGQIRKRYNIVRNYYINEYQVDLQKIGNAAKGL